MPLLLPDSTLTAPPFWVGIVTIIRLVGLGFVLRLTD
jgi:hypothetical protein